MQYLIGVDLGTSGTKTVLFDTLGQTVASASVEYPLYQPQNGWAEQEPEDWWQAACTTIRSILAQSGVNPADIAGLSLSGQMHGLVLTGDDDLALGRAIIWCDGRTQEDCLRDFTAAIGDPSEQVVRKVVGGYDFIAFSSDNKHSYDAEDCAKLVPALDAAVARDPSKPIFVVTHFHPKDTVDASHGGSGRPALREILNRYPQVVSFSGHTHSPLHDERCIWQGEFTAVNTSGLSYGCIPERCENLCGPILPFGREALYCMYMEVFADRLEIHRYNAEDQVEIKPDRLWRVALPYSPEKAVYTAARADSRQAPAFDPGTQMYFRYDYGYVYFVFDQARHDDFVHFYRLVLDELDEAGDVVASKSYRYVGNFFRLERNRDRRLVLKAPPNSMEAGKRYRCSMYPVETFGKEGEPLVITVRVRHSYTFNNLRDNGPQE